MGKLKIIFGIILFGIYSLFEIFIDNSIAVFIVFITLKATNNVDWSWYFCFLPLMVDLIILLITQLIYPYSRFKKTRNEAFNEAFKDIEK